MGVLSRMEAVEEFLLEELDVRLELWSLLHLPVKFLYDLLGLLRCLEPAVPEFGSIHRE